MSDRKRATNKQQRDSSDRRARRHAAKRARIIRNAWSFARRDGLAGISLRDLADSVDLRQPSLYAYFDSKLGLYDLMFADGQRQLLDRVLAREPLADPVEELISVVEDLVRFSSEDIVRHQLLFQRTIPGFEPSDAAMESGNEFLAQMVERLNAAGVDGRSEIDLFSAMVAGLCHQQVANDPGGDRYLVLSRRVVTMLLDDIDQRAVTRAAVEPTTNPTTKPTTERAVDPTGKATGTASSKRRSKR